MSQELRLIRRITLKLIPFLILLYLIAYVDRSAVGFAKLHMGADVGIGDAAYGLGAGLFFIGYFLFEVPSNVMLNKFGARVWIARILVTWGAIAAATALRSVTSTARHRVRGRFSAVIRSTRRASSSSAWPRSDSSFAVARPIPELAPVITTNGLDAAFIGIPHK